MFRLFLCAELLFRLHLGEGERAGRRAAAFAFSLLLAEVVFVQRTVDLAVECRSLRVRV